MDHPKGSTARMKQQHKVFADVYIETGNATEAYRRAGYESKDPRSAAGELLKHPLVGAYIADRLEKMDKTRIADADEVLAFLSSVMRSEVVDEIPIMSGDGIQTITQITPAARDKVKAAELLGKRYALFTDRSLIEGAMSVQIIDDVPRGDSAIPDSITGAELKLLAESDE